MLKDSSWSKNIRDDVVQVVELSHRKNGHKRLQLVTGDPNGDWQVKLAYAKEENWHHNAGATTSVDESNSSKSYVRGQPDVQSYKSSKKKTTE